ncbi:beta strand repeat-containing protein [Cellulophaga baltica]|uniref:beta strand repeat-containing protein n=1 Tax=Cellulophaga baltica TaxID=76594 RepID=UPI0037CBA1DD
MKKFKFLGIYLSLVLTIIIACTKEVGLYTEVEFEISETHVSDGFINTPLATSITVTPEELVEGYSYTYSYKINSGEGYFQDEAGNAIPEGEKIDLNPLSASLNYIATKIGVHSVTVTAEDTFGFQEQVTASYTISDVPVSWTATGPTGQVLLGSSQDISITLGSETATTGVTYERNYSFSQGTGTITSSPSGANETLNELINITPGTYTLTYVSTELGQTTLEFLLKDSNGQELVQIVSFEVVNELSTEKEITSFIVNGVEGTKVGTDITIELPEGTDLTTLSPVIIHTGASISPESETSQDFTNVVIYTVTAQDQTIQEYTVTLTVEGNEAKDITDFIIDGVAGIITGTNISLTLPAVTDVTALSPTVIHTGASVNPTSGVAQDFTNPVEYTVTATDGTTKMYNVTVSLALALSSDNDITSFSIDGVAGVISGTTITVTLPAGTNVSSLTPAIIHNGNTLNPDTGTAQDFTNPITYTVTADNLETQEYSVTVIVPTLSDTKDITSFSIDGVAGVISGTTITVTLPAGTDVISLTPAVIHDGNTVNPDTGIAQDFTSPVEYTVTAADGSTQVYSVTVTAPALSSTKAITAFTIGTVNGTVTGTNISLTLPAGTDVTTLSPSITHTGVSINPATNAAQDFTSPVEYTVTAADGSIQIYTVTVSLATPANQAPTAISDNYSVVKGTNNNLFNVIENDSDPDGDMLAVTLELFPLNGTATMSGNQVSYSPNINFVGTDQIGYQISDGNGGTDDAVITVTVNAPANQAPTAVATSVQRTGISQYIFDFAGDSSSDPDSNPITYLWDFGDGGSSTEINPNHTYITTGVYNASLTVSDGSLTNTTSLTVNARDYVIFTEGSNISDTFGTGSISVTGDLIITGSPTIFTLAATLITGVGANSNATFIIGSTQYTANTSNTSVPGLRNTISYSSGIYTYTLSVINTSGNSGIIRAVVTYP